MTLIELLKKKLAILLQILTLEKQVESQGVGNQVLLDKARSLLGQDASPQNLVPKEFACAESVSSILHSLWPEIAVVTGTYTLWQVFANSTEFEAVTNPLAGDIIISPTGLGNGTLSGHTGILDTDGIMSNNSATGLWDVHYTLDSWRKRYQVLGGLPLLFFRKK